MTSEKNIDVCVLVDIDADEKEMVLYSPLEQRNIAVKTTEDILEDVDGKFGVAFEVDLDTKTIV